MSSEKYGEEELRDNIYKCKLCGRKNNYTGKIIDTFENYPDNELWAKSEYKLIDMKKILIKRYSNNNKTVRTSKYNYAPFLCMKNQTTGEYHLEGVSPDCKNLYDALKMRYKGLNLPEYDFKEIK